MKFLLGHTSPETAYVVNDYPYGYKLRCKIRYWIEYRPKMGFRFCHQTTNPKKAGEYWNSPKCGTYSKIAMVMFINEENGFVEHDSLTEYTNGKKAYEWQVKYGEGVEPEHKKILEIWVKAKLAYDKKIEEMKI